MLIVVLIIGILAAIAVPQYQKAVLKSRFSSLVPLGKALNEGNEAYYLEHGSYTDSLGDLDVTTNDNNVQITMGNEDQHKYIKLTRSDIKNNLTMYQKHSANFSGEIHCEALKENAQANWLCQNGLKGTLLGSRAGYFVYALDENSVGTLTRKYYDAFNRTFVEGDICYGTRERGCGAYRNLKFTEGSICVGGSHWACDQSFDHSYCIGIFGPINASCRGASFKNYSVCYAHRSGTCKGTYDATSCCVGDTYCPEEHKCANKGITPPPEPAY